MTRRRSASTLLSIMVSTLGAALSDKFARAGEIHPPASFKVQMADLEKASGGRLGVAFLDTSTGLHAGHRADELFPMCSTFKLLAVAAVVARVDQGKERMDRVITFTRKDLVHYSSVTETRVGSAGISIHELCAAAVSVSDNTAANLLLAALGGPAAVTSFARSLGDDVTRLDRIEPDLNEALPGDPRDTTSPLSMLSDLRKLVLGKSLSDASRAQLTEWLIHNQTGDARLRAGLPSLWKVGDKTGSGSYGTFNDVAIVWPPDRAPILMAVYLTGATVDEDHGNKTIATVARTIAAATRR